MTRSTVINRDLNEMELATVIAGSEGQNLSEGVNLGGGNSGGGGFATGGSDVEKAAGRLGSALGL